MKCLGQIVLILVVNCCSIRSEKSDRTRVDTYELLNFILTDTAEFKINSDGYRAISDITMLPPPSWRGEGRFIVYLSEILHETDTFFLAKQLEESKTFETGGLAKYGFTVVEVSALQRRKIAGKTFWDKVHNEFGPGLLTVAQPIFNKSGNIAYIRIGYRCGEWCGGGEELIIEEVQGRWTIKEYLGAWEV